MCTTKKNKEFTHCIFERIIDSFVDEIKDDFVKISTETA